MENISEQTLIEQATSPSRLLELSRMFQLIYETRLQELLLEQQQIQQQEISTVAVTPPPSPSSSTAEDRTHYQGPVDLSYGGVNYSMASPSSATSFEPKPVKQQRQTSAKLSAARKIRFDPYQMSRRPRHLSAVSVKDSVEVDLMYHESMARQVQPTTDYTPEEKDRRDKIAYAARVSRAKERALHSLLKTEHDEAAEQNQSQKMFVAQKRVYATELCYLLGLPRKDLAAEWENASSCFKEGLDMLQHEMET